VVLDAPDKAMQLKAHAVRPSASALSSGEDLKQSTLQLPVKLEDRKSSRELSKVRVIALCACLTLSLHFVLAACPSTSLTSIDP
jgi:hypothetical protein